VVDKSSGMVAHAAGALLALAQFASQLKSVPRTGWLDRGVPPIQVESVADHSLGVALLAWVCALERRAEGVAIDPERVLMLAMLHDLAEAETGDLPPYDPATIPDEHEPAARRAFLETRHRRDPDRDAAKRAGEDAAVQKLLDTLPGGTRATLADVWADLRQGTSREARFVKQVDRLETFLQSRRYLRNDPTFPMASFHQEVFESIDDPLLTEIRDAALANDAPDLSGPQE
jgi:putative hydrolases of HD superfamily